jgi:hypothetical protein
MAWHIAGLAAAAVVLVAACTSASPSRSMPSTSVAASASPAASASTGASFLPSNSRGPSEPAPTVSPVADIVGTWTRTQSCQQELTAFKAKGLAKAEAFEWVTGNWVPDASPRSSGFCAGATDPVPHSHFFTDRGRFGSLDQYGNQVDDGTYIIASAGVLTFPSAASDFGYDGTILVGYAVQGNQLTFDVRVPERCVSDPTCTQAYGWALSAFFAGPPWERS